MPPGSDSDPLTGTFPPDSRADRGSAIRSETSLGTPRTLPDSAVSTPSFLPSFGDYDLLHLAGEGGMGDRVSGPPPIDRRNGGDQDDEIAGWRFGRTRPALSPGNPHRRRRSPSEYCSGARSRRRKQPPLLHDAVVPTNLGRQRHLFPRTASRGRPLISKVGAGAAITPTRRA